jgi:hypothetical protein
VQALPALDRAPEARQLGERALELLPRADDAPALRDALDAIPTGETAPIMDEP